MKTIYFLVVVLFLSSFSFNKTGYEKPTLPTNPITHKVEWTFSISSPGLKREQIYDNTLQWAAAKYTDKQIRSKDRTSGVLSIGMSQEYLYRGNPSQMNFLTSFLINDDSCKVVITNLSIRHKAIEEIYTDYSKQKRPSAKLIRVIFSIGDSMDKFINQIKQELNSKK